MRQARLAKASRLIMYHLSITNVLQKVAIRSKDGLS